MLIGYARISKADGSQSLDLQRDALREAGVAEMEVNRDAADRAHQERRVYSVPDLRELLIDYAGLTVSAPKRLLACAHIFREFALRAVTDAPAVRTSPQNRAVVRQSVARVAPDTFPGDLVCRQELRRYRQSRRRTYDTSIPPWCSRKRFRNPSSNGFGSQSNSGYCDKTLRTLRMRHRNLSLRLLAMSVADWISLSPRSNDGSSLLVAFTSTRHPMPS